MIKFGADALTLQSKVVLLCKLHLTSPTSNFVHSGAENTEFTLLTLVFDFYASIHCWYFPSRMWSQEYLPHARSKMNTYTEE